jgi:hypothetical protein
MDGKPVHLIEAVAGDEEINLKANFGGDSVYAEGHASAR